MPPTDTRFYPRVFASVSALVLGYALLRMFEPFLVPVLWAGLLALLLNPLNDRLQAAFRGRRTPAAILLTLGVVLVVVVPTIVVVGVFVTQTSELIARLQAGAAQYQIARPSDVLHLPAIDDLIQRVGTWLPVTPQQIQESAVRGSEQLLRGSITMIGSLFAGVLGAVVALVLALVLLFFLLRDGEQMVTRAMSLVPLDPERKTRLLAHLASVVRAIVLGSLVVALVQGTLIGIAFAIVKLPSPIVFAVLAMGASLVPLIGTTLVWVPAALWLLIDGRWGASLFLVIWAVAVVSSVDNVIRPLFISSRAKITTLPVFVGLVGGISAFGPIGVFLGPVLIALALALIEFAEEARAEAAPSAPPAGRS
jgi:predicted PurR-regulated permease PerM